MRQDLIDFSEISCIILNKCKGYSSHFLPNATATLKSSSGGQENYNLSIQFRDGYDSAKLTCNTHELVFLVAYDSTTEAMEISFDMVNDIDSLKNLNIELQSISSLIDKNCGVPKRRSLNFE